jgi:hypothetical protein
VHGPKQVTHAYLLAPATAHNGRFVTLDQSVELGAARTAKKDNLTVLRQAGTAAGHPIGSSRFARSATSELGSPLPARRS